MVARVFIDGVELAVPSIGGTYAITGSVTRRLNRPSQASVTIPTDFSIGGAGSRLKVYFDTTLWFHGFVMDCETDSGEDSGTTVYNAMDPLEMWQWRPVRDADGDFSKPTIIEDFISGPQIIQQMILNSIDPADIPSDAEGPLFIALGSFATGGVSLIGAPTDWPMTMAQLASLLISTGVVDIVMTPIDSGANMAQIDVYNGDYGTDLSGSIIFEYAMGQRNIRQIRWNEDMTEVVNKYWVYLGPRVGTPEDPKGDQHWRANITGDDTDLPGFPASPPYSTVIAKRVASQATYGVRMKIDIFDARGDEATVGRELFRRLWLMYSWIVAEPRELVHITPTRGDALVGAFDVGDLVRVRADSSIRGGFDAKQRIFEYTVSWDEDGVISLSDFQTSPDAEGFE